MLAIFLAVIIAAASLNSVNAVCSGNPPTHNGLPCATTTRYWDDQLGACGCGSNNSPFSWQWTTHTAAASQAIYDSGGATWCGAGCGTCWEITPTGDCPTGSPCATNTNPITVMVTNLCPYNGNAQWCPNPGNANQYGYHQHFDLMDYNMDGEITALGWNNPVVTYQRVTCGSLGSSSCSAASQCECGTSGCSASGGATTSSTHSTSAATTSSTHSTTATTGSSGSCSMTVSVSGGNIVFRNSGGKTIKGATVNVSGTMSWNNLVHSSGNTYTFPTWENSLGVGSTWQSGGYQGSAPSVSVVSVSC